MDRRIQGVGKGVSGNRRQEEPAVGRRLSAKSSEIIVDKRIYDLRSSVGGGVSLRRGEIRSAKPGFFGRVLQQWIGGHRRVGKEFSGIRRREDYTVAAAAVCAGASAKTSKTEHVL